MSDAGIGGISPNDFHKLRGPSLGKGEEMMDEEQCAYCGNPTGRAGEGEDSIYWLDGQIGPMCEECNGQLHKEILGD